MLAVKDITELIKVVYEVNKLGYNVEVKFIGKDYFGGIERLRAFSRKLKIEDKICFYRIFIKERYARSYDKCGYCYTSYSCRRPSARCY